jgi:hypothetical protein
MEVEPMPAVDAKPQDLIQLPEPVKVAFVCAPLLRLLFTVSESPLKRREGQLTTEGISWS